MPLCDGYADSVISKGAELPKNAVTPPMNHRPTIKVARLGAAVWSVTPMMRYTYAT